MATAGTPDFSPVSKGHQRLAAAAPKTGARCCTLIFDRFRPLTVTVPLLEIGAREAVATVLGGVRESAVTSPGDSKAAKAADW